MYGSNGVTWLKQLPDTIEQCVQKWSLSKLKPYSNLTYNCVLSGMMHEQPIVLKLGCDSKVIDQEIIALKAFNGYGCVDVIQYNPNLGAALLARIITRRSINLIVSRQRLFCNGHRSSTHAHAT